MSGSTLTPTKNGRDTTEPPSPPPGGEEHCSPTPRSRKPVAVPSGRVRFPDGGGRVIDVSWQETDEHALRNASSDLEDAISIHSTEAWFPFTGGV